MKNLVTLIVISFFNSIVGMAQEGMDSNICNSRSVINVPVIDSNNFEDRLLVKPKFSIVKDTTYNNNNKWHLSELKADFPLSPHGSVVLQTDSSGLYQSGDTSAFIVYVHPDVVGVIINIFPSRTIKQ